MDTQPAFGFKELFTHIVGDMAKAICERNGETKQQQYTRTQAAAHTIMSFQPRDVIEAMLAGHCVMFHEVITDSVRDTLRGEMDLYRRATRGNIVALDKAFGNNLERLERYQARPSEGRRDMPEAVPEHAQGEAETAPVMQTPPRAAREQAAATQTPPAGTPEIPEPSLPEPSSPPSAETPARYYPTPEAIAACRANQEAMAALDAGDAEGFARAMGIDQPSEAWLAAFAAQPGGVDREAFGTRPPGPITPSQANRSGGPGSGDRQMAKVARDGARQANAG